MRFGEIPAGRQRLFPRLAMAVALLPLASAACSAAPPGGVRTVSGREELAAALKDARGGMEIRLAPGDYGMLNLSGRKFEGGRLTLIAATAERPRFSGVKLNGASGVAIAGMQIEGSERPIVSLSSGNDLVFAGNLLTGVNRNRDPWDDTQTGIWVRNARNVTIVGNVLEDLRTVLYVQRSDGVVFAENSVAHVREGLNVAASRNLDIVRNSFRDFSPMFHAKEHPDAVQFWTSRETEGSSAVRLIENVMILGGCKAVQGIFIRSETSSKPDGPQIRHSDFTIRRNVYYGSSPHGITAASIDRARIENNVVIASPYAESGVRTDAAQARDLRCSGAFAPYIRSLRESEPNILRLNVATAIAPATAARGNQLVGKGGASYTDVFRVRPTGDAPALEDFVSREGSRARSQGMGLLEVFPYGAPADYRQALKSALEWNERKP